MVLKLLIMFSAVILPWSSSTEEVSLNGVATYMNDGIMERVAKNREVSLDGYVGGVALNRKGDLFREVWILWEETEELEGPYLVIDCAQEGKHYRDREEAERVVEVDADQARKHGMYSWGTKPVTVYFVYPEFELWWRNGTAK